jgi:hypothetical protein
VSLVTKTLNFSVGENLSKSASQGIALRRANVGKAVILSGQDSWSDQGVVNNMEQTWVRTGNYFCGPAPQRSTSQE